MSDTGLLLVVECRSSGTKVAEMFTESCRCEINCSAELHLKRTVSTILKKRTQHREMCVHNCIKNAEVDKSGVESREQANSTGREEAEECIHSHSAVLGHLGAPHTNTHTHTL